MKSLSQEFIHWCEQGDDVDHYSWLAHDGRNFGFQRIVDKHTILETSFGTTSKTSEVSLFYYMALNEEDQNGNLKLLQGTGQSIDGLEGYSEALGDFRLRFIKHSGKVIRRSFLNTKHSGFEQLKESVLKGLRLFQDEGKQEKFIGLAGDLFERDDYVRNPNLIVFQITGVIPFEVDVVFESSSSVSRNSLSGEVLTKEIDQLSKGFDEKFESKFGLRAKGFGEKEIEFAKAAMSNMVGGIGYFYGSSKVQGENNNEPVPYWKAPLYTAVPSRSFFPRGFLWDEGFHNLLISKWDREISMDILGHWFDLMNWDGWIPREQILGAEARARVPDEFVVQHQKAANPPTLMLTLHSMVNNFDGSLTDHDYDYLNRLWPRLRAWYQWFNSTQVGELPGTYRWRGRNPKSQKELNPKTLTSGLDDYPRASHPTNDERHLDLRCWMTLAANLIANFAKLIDKDPIKYENSYKYLSDNNMLDALHWSYSSNGYMDYGLHTDEVVLKRINPKTDKVRVVNRDPNLRFVDSFGYVSFFPLFLQIIDPYSVKLRKVLEDLRRPDLLWTPYGLRSLAKNSPFYNKWNTEHDPPYWRGAIWININYLAIRSLKYYSEVDGPNREYAGEIYRDLRKNVIDNIMKQYNTTGYLWEHYNDKTGKGEGCRPFNGWSALVVLIMGESY
ncbi:Mannosyl-oligosaccharide glucosidase [Armadillidium nasatum]|uniref:Mannosyl-oligosaccharide glucosidase n=1 Tax=Armadillidium nasatum TaxID=96803 RepID=A0A5N5SLV0_9CRUS|nr:Mannosyl-oligosaccharide glucosidase [Armadillidium nasatum]